MAIRQNIKSVYFATGSMRNQSAKIKRFGKRVAKLKLKIKHQHTSRRRERLEKKYKKQAQKLSEAIKNYTHHMRQANHHLATLKTEF